MDFELDDIMDSDFEESFNNYDIGDEDIDDNCEDDEFDDLIRSPIIDHNFCSEDDDDIEYDEIDEYLIAN